MIDPHEVGRDCDYHFELVEDKPASGMWHCGPNAAWVTVTHLPTMISARAFDQSHHHARKAAKACCEMMVEQSLLLKCQFPDRIRNHLKGQTDDASSDAIETGAHHEQD